MLAPSELEVELNVGEKIQLGNGMIVKVLGTLDSRSDSLVSLGIKVPPGVVVVRGEEVAQLPAVLTE
jgi:hypothetical protein